MTPQIIREDIARAKAKAVLKELSVHPPIISSSIANKLQIAVHHHCLPNIDFTFSFKRNNSYNLCIYLSGDNNADNWATAKGLGHIVLGHYDIYEVDTIFETRLTDEERIILDREASIFAEELLMPYDWILKENKDLPYYKKLFQIPEKSLINRLVGFGIY